MMRAFQILAAILILGLLGLVAGGYSMNDPRPEGEPGPEADALALGPAEPVACAALLSGACRSAPFLLQAAAGRCSAPASRMATDGLFMARWLPIEPK